MVDLSAEGPSAQPNWDDLAGPSWSRRLDLYAALPGATEPLSSAAWERALTAGLALETSLLRDVGFVFESSDHSYGFYRRVSDDVCVERHRRVVAQADFYAAQAPDAQA